MIYKFNSLKFLKICFVGADLAPFKNKTNARNLIKNNTTGFEILQDCNVDHYYCWPKILAGQRFYRSILWDSKS
jgi:hypothetical protein